MSTDTSTFKLSRQRFDTNWKEWLDTFYEANQEANPRSSFFKSPMDYHVLWALHRQYKYHDSELTRDDYQKKYGHARWYDVRIMTKGIDSDVAGQLYVVNFLRCLKPDAYDLSTNMNLLQIYYGNDMSKIPHLGTHYQVICKDLLRRGFNAHESVSSKTQELVLKFEDENTEQKEKEDLAKRICLDICRSLPEETNMSTEMSNIRSMSTEMSSFPLMNVREHKRESKVLKLIRQHKRGTPPSSELSAYFYTPTKGVSIYWKDGESGSISLVADSKVDNGNKKSLIHNSCCGYFFCHGCNEFIPKSTHASNGQINQHMKSCKRAISLLAKAEDDDDEKDKGKDEKSDENDKEVEKKEFSEELDGRHTDDDTGIQKPPAQQDIAQQDIDVYTDPVISWFLQSEIHFYSFLKDPICFNEMHGTKLSIDNILKAYEEASKARDEVVKSKIQDLLETGDHHDFALQISGQGPYTFVDVLWLDHFFQKRSVRLSVIDKRDVFDVGKTIEFILKEYGIEQHIVWTTVGKLGHLTFLELPDSMVAKSSQCICKLFDSLAEKAAKDFLFPNDERKRGELFFSPLEEKSHGGLLHALVRYVKAKRQGKLFEGHTPPVLIENTLNDDPLTDQIIVRMIEVLNSIKDALDTIISDSSPNIGMTMSVVRALKLHFEANIVETDRYEGGFVWTKVLFKEYFQLTTALSKTNHGAGFERGKVESRLDSVVRALEKQLNSTWFERKPDGSLEKKGKDKLLELSRLNKKVEHDRQQQFDKVIVEKENRQLQIQNKPTKLKEYFIEGMKKVFDRFLTTNPDLAFVGFLDPRLHNGTHLALTGTDAERQEVEVAKKKLAATLTSSHSSRPTKLQLDGGGFLAGLNNQGHDVLLNPQQTVDVYLLTLQRTAAQDGNFEDALSFWGDEASQKLYPDLAVLARKWLAVPTITLPAISNTVDEMNMYRLAHYFRCKEPSIRQTHEKEEGETKE